MSERGLYRITYNDLSGLGYRPEEIDPTTLRLTVRDLAVGVDLIGGEDGRFDPSDFLLLDGGRPWPQSIHNGQCLSALLGRFSRAALADARRLGDPSGRRLARSPIGPRISTRSTGFTTRFRRSETSTPTATSGGGSPAGRCGRRRKRCSSSSAFRQKRTTSPIRRLAAFLFKGLETPPISTGCRFGSARWF
ncbi:MAG: hypothetical protein KatS3mg115_0103 [Candidatus Poribacteria bacterium]|nr:MAG: hypothetical protein KatS3mg115_0103 [Candidatus Poribacteria bacterium]